MKIIIILVLVCMLALGAVGAVGFLSKGFTSFDKGEIKEQINSLKESVQELTNKVKDAYQSAKQHGSNEEQTNCSHENIDENGVCQDCGTCTHKYVFGGECMGCHKSIDEIRANCEHEMDGCRCTKCSYEAHDVDPETYTCRNCGMLIINTNSVCLNGHQDNDGDGLCDYCGKTVQTEQPQEPEQPVVIERIAQLDEPTYYVGDSVDPANHSVTIIYSNGTTDYDVFDSMDVDTSIPGTFTGTAYYKGYSCEFSYIVEEEYIMGGGDDIIDDGDIEDDEGGPTGSGGQMEVEDGEF